MPLALILMLLFGGGATLAVDSSLPGDALYPVKLNFSEKLESAVAVTETAKKIVEQDHLRERLREVTVLSLRGKDESRREETRNLESTSTKNRESASERFEKEKEGSNRIRNSSIKIDREDDDDDEDEGDDDRWKEGIPVTTPTPLVQSSVSTQAIFTLADVTKHNKSTDCYSVVRGSVYDLTLWIKQHPGGSSAIISMCGIDATQAFMDQHGGQGRPESELASFKIGVIK